MWEIAGQPLSSLPGRLVHEASCDRMDSERLGNLIDRHSAALELYARQWCDDPADVVQEAFVKLSVLSVEPLNPAAWLFRAVRNGAINEGISRKRRLRHETRAAAWFEASRATRHDPAFDVEAVQGALASLPVEEREVIVARLWGGLTFEQVAELTGSSSSSAHRLYQAGLAALRDRLGVSCRTKPTRSTPS